MPWRSICRLGGMPRPVGQPVLGGPAWYDSCSLSVSTQLHLHGLQSSADGIQRRHNPVKVADRRSALPRRQRCNGRRRQLLNLHRRHSRKRQDA